MKRWLTELSIRDSYWNSALFKIRSQTESKAMIFPGNYYHQVAIIFTNRLLGCCSCLSVITWHFPGFFHPEQVQGLVRAATPTWFGATTSSPFPAASPCSPYETRTGPRGHCGPQHLQTGTRSSLGGAGTAALLQTSASRWVLLGVTARIFHAASPADGTAGNPASSWGGFVEAVSKTAFLSLDWLWSWEKRLQKKKMQ